MNWKHTKSFLIILLAAVNVFLFFLASDYYKENNYTSEETASGAAKLLKESGINVSEALLSVKNDTADILTCGYDREEYLCSVAALLFGKEADGIYLLPGGIRAETYEGSSALLNYDMSLSFTSSELIGKEQLLSESAYTPEKKESSADREALERLIALPSGSLDDARCIKAGEYMFIAVEQTENGLPLFDMNCIFGIRDGKIVYASGKHLFSVPEGRQNTQILNRVNILFSEKERGVSGTVKDMALCYTLYEDTATDTMLLVPSYTVTYSDGRTAAINAVSKDLY